MVSDIIESAVAQIPNSKYLRATDIDANIEVSEIELGTDVWCIFTNLAPITVLAGGQVHGYECEIKLLKKSDFDDNTAQGEVIRNELIPIATTLRNKIQADSRHSYAEYDEDYTIDPADQVKIYDSIMTGVMLSFTIYIDNNIVC